MIVKCFIIFFQRFLKILNNYFWLAISLIPSNSFAQVECPSINVKIQNIGNNNGVIACAKPKGFLVNCRVRIQDHVNTNKRKDAILSFQILNREIMLLRDP
jgi:hypothetical protein